MEACNMDILIKLAEKEDLQAILEIQYLAFQKEAKKFNDYNIEPLQQTIASLEEEFKIFTFLKALDEHGKIHGSTRFKEIKTENNGFVYLEKSKKGV